MVLKKYDGIHAFGLIFLLSFILLTGCKFAKDDSVEYVNNEVSYNKGESCVERYILYEDSGKYERYIAGKYRGNSLPGIYFGTLFQTGSYTRNDQALQNITFYPKKQYNFTSKELEYLGLEGQLPFSGRLTDKTLTITWEIWSSLLGCIGEVPIIYERQ